MVCFSFDNGHADQQRNLIFVTNEIEKNVGTVKLNYMKVNIWRKEMPCLNKAAFGICNIERKVSNIQGVHFLSLNDLI